VQFLKMNTWILLYDSTETF